LSNWPSCKAVTKGCAAGGSRECAPRRALIGTFGVEVIEVSQKYLIFG
jgi:hypothetical protein